MKFHTVLMGSAFIVGYNGKMSSPLPSQQPQNSAKPELAAAGAPESVSWAPWQALRTRVAADRYELTPENFQALCGLFLSHYAGQERTPAELTREYPSAVGQGEVLRVVNSQGQAIAPDAAMLNTYQALRGQYPVFGDWFALDWIHENGQTKELLLPGRWLCHLVGWLHPTVEIFIDPPHMPGLTLVQVRSLEKFEAPGAFDIPCAGHVSGAEDWLPSLRKELGEELNLALEDLSGLREIARYTDLRPGRESGPVNQEFRVLYQSILKPEAAGKIRFSDGEVAGLALFSVAELRRLAAQNPERAAGGLTGALPYYQETT